MDPRPHIAVVEDEAVQRQMLADYLARQNFRVSALGDGAALRRLVERELPALVMLDVGLPGEDGFALARWLREKSRRVGCWRGSRACCGGPSGRRPLALACGSAGGCSISSVEYWSIRMTAARNGWPRASSTC